MPVFTVETPRERYPVHVERGILTRLSEFLPSRGGTVFVVTTSDVWELHGEPIKRALDCRNHRVLTFPNGEPHKRVSTVEAMAEQMVEAGGDRSSVVVAFGGGIATDMGGFLAASFMRGIPVIQVPTTLLAQVDAAIGGKTGVNLQAGKNLFGAFHQPLAVLIDPDVLKTLPAREYRAGLFEILKAGIIRDRLLFDCMTRYPRDVLGRIPDVVDSLIAGSVKVKVDVVSADEKESNLRRILNFGHTIGHSLEAETEYSRFLHGEAVAFGMHAATHLSHITGHLSAEDAVDILQAIDFYGPIPPLDGISAENLVARLGSDKKSIQGKVHFVLATAIGETKVVSGLDPALVLEATRAALKMRTAQA
jgi:3-dehydroquinate synthase